MERCGFGGCPTNLSQLGEYTVDVSRFLSFELQEADAFGRGWPGPTSIAATTDAARNVLNPRAYLTACAEAGGAVPEDVEGFLPWNLSEEARRRWSLAGVAASTDTS
jgi:hypothetical protein